MSILTNKSMAMAEEEKVVIRIPMDMWDTIKQKEEKARNYLERLVQKNENIFAKRTIYKCLKGTMRGFTEALKLFETVNDENMDFVDFLSLLDGEEDTAR